MRIKAFELRRILGLKLKKFYALNEVEDMPEKLNYGELYFSEEDGFLAFKCPCSCKGEEHIFVEDKMNRKKGEWAVKVHDQKLKLIGSVGSPFECNSHYYITYNKIEWLGW